MFSHTAIAKSASQAGASTPALWERPVNVPISPSHPTTQMAAAMECSERARDWKSPTPGAESDASAASSSAPTTCLCGNRAEDGGIYCSIDCARSDAFSSLCYKPGSSSSARHASVPLTSTPVHPLHPQQAPSHLQWHGSIAVPPSSTCIPGPLSAPLSIPDWDSSSHYRRVARADMRREERREERKRRRAEGSVGSTSSRCTTLSTSSSSRSCSSRVPELVGGGHSRNPSTASTASTAMSDWTGFGGGLSRNASATSAAGRRYRGDMVEVIREDEDEEYLLSVSGHGNEGGQQRIKEPDDSFEHSDSAARPYPSIRNGQVRRPSNSKKRPADAMGLGKDMRDILEEIISMEQSFSVDDDEDALEQGAAETDVRGRFGRHDTGRGIVSPRPRRQPGQFATLPRSAAATLNGTTSSVAHGQSLGSNLLTAVFDRSHPPRTPSPAPLLAGDRKRRAPDAPGAPIRGHRNSMSVGHLFAPPSVFPAGTGPRQGSGASRNAGGDDTRPYPVGTQGLEGGARLHRPPSFVMGHQSSLSESHTALYLATASPEAAGPAAGATASRHIASPGMETNPKMKSRNSLTFSPEIAGPELPILSNLGTVSSASSDVPDARFRPSLGGFAGFGAGNVNTTPSRRRPAPSPNANYASIGGWRFPSNPAIGGQGAVQTPRGPTKGEEQERRRSVSTPTGVGAAHYASQCLRGDSAAFGSGGSSRHSGMSVDSPCQSNRYDHDDDKYNDGETDAHAELAGRAAPHLFWPPPRHLEPSLFPTSPASGTTGTEDGSARSSRDAFGAALSGISDAPQHANRRKGSTSPPALTSGLKLGVLLGSGGGSGSVGSGSRSSRGSGGSYRSHESYGSAVGLSRDGRDLLNGHSAQRTSGGMDLDDEEGGLAYLAR